MHSLIIHLMLLSSVHADIPKVTLSPDSVAASPLVEATIERVVLYGNRAVVHRKATQKVSSGTHTIRLPNLSSTVDPSSIRLNVQNGTLLRMDTQIVNTEEFSIKEIADIIKEMEQLDLEIQQLKLQRVSFQSEVTLLQQSINTPLSKNDYTNNIAQYNLQLWKQNWTFVSNKMQEAQKELRRIDDALLSKRTVFAQLQKKSLPFLQGNISKTSLEVVVVVHTPSSKTITMDLEYTVQGARWTPTYDVHYDSKTDNVRIESAAIVVQNSGENWKDVQLEFATSNQRSYQSLPNLLTWTLGEKNEFIPEARAANSRPSEPLYPPFATQASNSELNTIAQREAYVGQRTYLSQLTQTLQQSIPSTKTYTPVPPSNLIGARSGHTATNRATSVEFSSMEVAGMYDMEAAYEEDIASPQMGLAMNISAEPRMVSESSVSRSARGSRSMKSKSKESYDGGLDTVRMANMPLALEASNLYSPIRSHNSTFNISMEQGLKLLWKSPGTFTVKSDGQQHRIPLQSTTHTATSFYEASPSLEEISYLKGTVENTNAQAILQGAANIFLNGHFTVQTTLQTTKAGGLLELPLGADENIRIKRNITPLQRKEGLIKQQEITDYTIKIEIGNYKQKPISIRVLDQLPISQNKEITIEYLTASHPYKQKDKNHQGILYWDLEIPAGQTETIELKYAISRPKNWKLWGY